jgi:hypothetical protein
VLLALPGERFDVVARERGEVHELALAESGEPRVVDAKVADNGGDDLLAERLRQLDLLLALQRAQRVGRGEEDYGLACGVGLAQRLAPALAGPDVVQIDEDIVSIPAVGGKPAPERERVDVVTARMRNEKTRHVSPPPMRSRMRAF